MKTKTRNLRRIVSIMLCVIISCICLVTPAYAVEAQSETSAASTDIYYYNGVRQIVMTPVIVDNNGNILAAYTSTISALYPNGQFLVNLDVSSVSKAAYVNYGCNAWLFEIFYVSGSDVVYIDIEITAGSETFVDRVYDKANGREGYLIPGDEYYDYFTYELTWHYTDGAAFVSGGHVNRR